MNFKSYSDLADDIKRNLHKLHDKNIDLVVGIPRSGMIPGYMIALALNTDCMDLNAFLQNAPLARGRTRSTRAQLSNAWDAKNVLIVDDSYMSGKSMKAASAKLPNHGWSRPTLPHRRSRLSQRRSFW